MHRYFFKHKIITLLLVSCCISIAGAQIPESSDGKMPEIIPDFQLEDIDGNQVSLHALRGNVVMINFWATWCPPCVEEMPAMDALKKTLADTRLPRN